DEVWTMEQNNHDLVTAFNLFVIIGKLVILVTTIDVKFIVILPLNINPDSYWTCGLIGKKREMLLTISTNAKLFIVSVNADNEVIRFEFCLVNNGARFLAVTR